MSLTIVTTFSKDNWDQYANRSIPTWFKYLGNDVKFHFHCDWEPIDDPRITYTKLSLNKEDFLKRNYKAKRTHFAKGHHGLWDRYCHKVFAQCETALEVNTDLLLFLDADVACMSTFTKDDAYRLLNGNFCGYIGRDEIGSETGFILYNLNLDPDRTFFNNFLNYYKLDKIFDLFHWDDCYVFDTCRKENTSHSFINLSGKYYSFIDPISVGPLGEYFDHWMSKSGKARGRSKYREMRGTI
jgi:hypothetical protein